MKNDMTIWSEIKEHSEESSEELKIVFNVDSKEKVNDLTIEIGERCMDIIYEPRYMKGSYESCILVGENIRLIIRTSECFD